MKCFSARWVILAFPQSTKFPVWYWQQQKFKEKLCWVWFTAGVRNPWSYYWSLLYRAIPCSRADSLHSHVILQEWIAFIARFLISTEVVYLQRWHGWCHMKLLPSQCVLCTPDNQASCHFMQSHICKVYVCLAVTCHLHFWQNGRGLLRANAAKWEWNGYWNKSQHRKLTQEKKILPPLQQGFKLATFQSQVWRSNHWAIPAPYWIYSNLQAFRSFCWQLLYLIAYLKKEMNQVFHNLTLVIMNNKNNKWSLLVFPSHI